MFPCVISKCHDKKVTRVILFSNYFCGFIRKSVINYRCTSFVLNQTIGAQDISLILNCRSCDSLYARCGFIKQRMSCKTIFYRLILTNYHSDSLSYFYSLFRCVVFL